MRNLNKRLLSRLSPRLNSTKISAAQPFRGRCEEEESAPGDGKSFAIAEICTELASQVRISLQPRPPSSPVPSLLSPRGFGLAARTLGKAEWRRMRLNPATPLAGSPSRSHLPLTSLSLPQPLWHLLARLHGRWLRTAVRQP
jgi:hypothetical protein